jgi:endonuclease-3
MAKTDWEEAIKPLLKAYKGKRHPLEYKNTYQLVVMVVLAGQATDKLVNDIAPQLFEVFPNMESLARATPETLFPVIGKIRNFANKANWLIGIAQRIGTDRNIPATLDALVDLPGIGRKSANVILRESGQPPEGVMVDLHTVRVAPRLGIASGSDPKKIEEQIMRALPKKQWDAGMAMSFHGRKICRPKPECEICFMTNVCKYYQAAQKKKNIPQNNKPKKK